ncbi:unnamed protein product, partial [Rotaria sordida]
NIDKKNIAFIVDEQSINKFEMNKGITTILYQNGVRINFKSPRKPERPLLADNTLTANNLVLALFVIEGENQRQEVEPMSGSYRLSIDQVILTAREVSENNIKAVALFPCLNQRLSSSNADEAYNRYNLMSRVIRNPSTPHGHDSILYNGDEDNDTTVKALYKQALVLAKAAADIVAPSDVMNDPQCDTSEIL